MTEVPGGHPLLRLPKPPPDFVSDGYKPTWQVLAPSSEEKAHPPVRVSVWDETLTSSSRAAAFRAARPLLVLRSESADAVMRAGASRVVYDPLSDAVDAERPGAEGHAGIEGLARSGGEPTPDWKARLDRIAAVFELVERVD